MGALAPLVAKGTRGLQALSQGYSGHRLACLAQAEVVQEPLRGQGGRDAGLRDAQGGAKDAEGNVVSAVDDVDRVVAAARQVVFEGNGDPAREAAKFAADYSSRIFRAPAS
eukprot:15454914-Alexandrium_andersonii.AAC.1